MILLAKLIQIVLCLVSMCLTALFALSIAGIEVINVDSLEAYKNNNTRLLEAILFVFIGICIDASKYIFWAASSRGYYKGVGIILMLFSWFASVSFFMTTEQTALQQKNISSIQYKMIEARIESLESELLSNEIIMRNRLASQYHKQWELAEVNVVHVSQLRLDINASKRELLELIESRDLSTTGTGSFFNELSKFAGFPERIIRWVSFGFLAMLLEVSALASISLVGSHRREGQSRERYTATDFESLFKDFASDERRLAELLAQDICMGKIDPVIRKIRASPYGLGLSSIKRVLEELSTAGIIEKGARNSYRRIGSATSSKEIVKATLAS